MVRVAVSGRLGEGAATLGSFTWKSPWKRKGVVTMKITSNTSTTSVKGTMLISAMSLVAGLRRLCMGFLSASESFGNLRNDDFRFLGHGIEPGLEPVVDENRGDGHEEAGSGGHQGLGDALGNDGRAARIGLG